MNIEEEKLIKCIKISIDSLIWISENNTDDMCKCRAKDTVKEIARILKSSK